MITFPAIVRDAGTTSSPAEEDVHERSWIFRFAFSVQVSPSSLILERCPHANLLYLSRNSTFPRKGQDTRGVVTESERPPPDDLRGLRCRLAQNLILRQMRLQPDTRMGTQASGISASTKSGVSTQTQACMRRADALNIRRR